MDDVVQGVYDETTEVGRFLASLSRLSGADVEKVASTLDSDALLDEVDWWRATIAIDKVARRSRCSREAGRFAAEAARVVEVAAGRSRATLPEDDVRRVARAAADVARGLAAGPAARPVVGLLLESWAPVLVAF
jgi:hypothetical protein